jgi:hypothetical protein
MEEHIYGKYDLLSPNGRYHSTQLEERGRQGNGKWKIRKKKKKCSIQNKFLQLFAGNTNESVASVLAVLA